MTDDTPTDAGRHDVCTAAAVDLDAIPWQKWKRADTWPVGEVVYTLADDDGVFYVGITKNVMRRMSAHRGKRGFGRRARYMRAVTVNSREDAVWLERQMIYLFDPSGNDQHRRKVA